MPRVRGVASLFVPHIIPRDIDKSERFPHVKDHIDETARLTARNDRVTAKMKRNDGIF